CPSRKRQINPVIPRWKIPGYRSRILSQKSMAGRRARNRLAMATGKRTGAVSTF
ncbi:MAG: hypothetical protein, partial [Olavius algarvensis Gamma 3 endosymbiont]